MPFIQMPRRLRPEQAICTLALLSALLVLPRLSWAQGFYEDNSQGLINQISLTGNTSTFTNTSSYTRGYLTLDTAGNLYTAVSSGQIDKISATGAVSTYATAQPYSEGLVFDNSGNLFTSDASVQGVITKIDETGNVSTYLNTSNQQPTGLAIDSQNTLYYASIARGIIYKVIPPNGTTTFSATAVAFATGLNTPDSIVFDQSGNLYVDSQNTDTISVISPSGTVSTFVTSSALSGAEQLTFDGAGNLYAACFENSDIVKITPNKEVSIFATQPNLGGGEAFGIIYSSHITSAASAPEPESRLLIEMGFACISISQLVRLKMRYLTNNK